MKFNFSSSAALNTTHFFVATVSKTELWKVAVKQEPSCDWTVCPAVATETRPRRQIINFPSRLIPPAVATVAGMTQCSRVNATSETRRSRLNTDCWERPLTALTQRCAVWLFVCQLADDRERATGSGEARGNPVALGCSRQKAHTKSRGMGINPRGRLIKVGLELQKQ